ncbi:cystatin-A-like [Chanodichthys erythropterus]|uniref:cystatin-A-like n=1 Tax=Chanodichthys erythropterus TaxID=933992 RepID=UPI00351F32D6
MSAPGGWSPVEPVTPEVEKICLEVKSHIEERIRNNSGVYTPISFAHQVVEGINYVVKVQVGVDLCVHAMIFAALPCHGGKRTVTGIHFPQKLSDLLKPF